MALVKPVRGEHPVSKLSGKALAEPLAQECYPVGNILAEQLLCAQHGLHDTRLLPRW